MTDSLIDRLTGDLRPGKTLTNMNFWVQYSACLAAIAAAVLGLLGLRADYAAALQNGAIFWKSSIFLMAWIGSALLITDISRPHGGLKKHHGIPLVAAGAVLVWQFAVQASRFSWADMLQSLNDDSAITCFSVITGGGAVAMKMAWSYWFSKTASPHPTVLGALAGFSAGCLAATAYALHCQRDAALYVSVYYGTPVLLLSFSGAFLGKKLLKW